MKQAKKKPTVAVEPEGLARSVVFWLTVSLLVLVPLAFSNGIHRMFSLPKFTLLTVGTSALIPLTILAALRNGELRRLLGSKCAALVWLYLAAVSVSTIFAVAPTTSLFGSFENQMGLITRFCFFVCFVGLVIGIQNSNVRFERVLWAMLFTGAAVATYACAQFSGQDPFLAPSTYTLSSAAGPIVRATSTLGHADYLGNFLLYTTPISAGLTLASRGGARWFAATATLLSLSAIAFSGTRGAWVGLGVGAITFAALSPLRGLSNPVWGNRRLWIKSALALAAVLIAIWIISTNPASRGIALRARSFVAEGFSGSGRIILWRDSLKMLPAFAITGAGPDGFRKAFLPYKSRQLALLAPQTNNENSHNSYLDAAISHGLIGAVSYVAIIVSALSLMLGAYRRANRRMRMIITGLLSSFAAVIVHNIFIFDQIPTGLYFFAVVGLANAARSLATAQAHRGSANGQPSRAYVSGSSAKGARSKAALSRNMTPGVVRWRTLVVITSGAVLVVLALWYSVALLQADAEIKSTFALVNRDELDLAMKHGERATSGPDPTGGYDLLFAQALAIAAERLQSQSGSNNPERPSLVAAREKAINRAMASAERSLKHTLTPDSSYLLLAYLALASGDVSKLRASATEALRLDPNYCNGHWLMAESYMAEGNPQLAAHEAEIAVELNPSLDQAQTLLVRARDKIEGPEERTERLLKRARKLEARGHPQRAKQVLLGAIRVSDGPCARCHRALALFYEAANSYVDAIAQWEMFMREDPAAAEAEQITSRVKSLAQMVKQKDNKAR